MQGTTKIRGSRALNMQASGTSGASLTQGHEMSALKARRNKKVFTAAQQQGKVTGRWTEEEHQRFNEGM